MKLIMAELIAFYDVVLSVFWLLVMSLVTSAEFRDSSYHEVINTTTAQNYKCDLYRVSTTDSIQSLIECVKRCRATDCCVKSKFKEAENQCFICLRPNTTKDYNLLDTDEQLTGDGKVYLESVKPPMKQCADLYGIQNAVPVSGVYTLYIKDNQQNTQRVNTFCDMDTYPGGWTVFQRRIDGTVSFDRLWADYKKGFGDIRGNFWLGNDYMALMTSLPGTYQLRVDMESLDNQTTYAVYDNFRINDESDGYRLNIGSFTGNVVDRLSNHNGMKFTTSDVDNDRKPDGNCVTAAGSGGFWYNWCTYVNSNGEYMTDNIMHYKAIKWQLYPLKRIEMKFRPMDPVCP